MGFGVSGATAVVVLGLFISAGLVYDAASTSYEEVSDARDLHEESLLDRRNTDVNVTGTNTTGNGTLTVAAENLGSTALTVNGTNLLVDNEPVGKADGATWRVEGTTGTDVWLPGETLNVTVSRERLDAMLGNGTAPGRVKLVTENGVSDVGAV